MKLAGFSRMTKQISDEKGASAVEFALVLPILILLIFGIIQFGFIFNDYISITHAAREGVRWASLREPESVVKEKTIDAAPSITLMEDDIEVSNPAPSADDQGQPVTVSVSYSVPIDVPIMQSLLGESFILASSATQRIE
jgi:Flp pilus assembly protein TadG